MQSTAFLYLFQNLCIAKAQIRHILISVLFVQIAV
nr:MAG TPA: hypothetical protein [Caudoviricetes sp.]